MSKNQKETIEIPVETVDNWKKTTEYLVSTIKFWFPHDEKKWPFNLIIENIETLSEDIGIQLSIQLMPF